MTEHSELSGRWDSASEIAQQLRLGEQSATEIATDALSRITALNPEIGAVTFTDAEHALDAAAELDLRFSQSGELKSLAGVPTLMKDLYGFRPGWPTTFGGLPAAQNEVAPEGLWSRFPLQMVGHDAVLLGQTNSSTFGFCGATDNKLFGPTRNPFNHDRNAGGSSGGSAAAVAAGIVPFAGASDAGGSIRIPAAWTNTFGFQPSAGRVPSTPRPALFHLGPHLYEGPISRTVEDALLVMNALQGHDPHDPYSFPSPELPISLLTQGISGKRVGLSLDFGGFPVNPMVHDTVIRAAQTFENLGAIVEPVDLKFGFSHDELTRMWLRSVATLMLFDLEAFEVRGMALGQGDIPEPVRYWTEEVKRMSARELNQDRVIRSGVLDGLLEATNAYDFIIGPTVVDLPSINNDSGSTVGPSVVDGVDVDPIIGWCPTYLTNFSGAPSASVPAGLVEGLPVGLLIIGRKHFDGEVFAAAAAFEEAQPWAQHYSLLS